MVGTMRDKKNPNFWAMKRPAWTTQNGPSGPRGGAASGKRNGKNPNKLGPPTIKGKMQWRLEPIDDPQKPLA
ncbi:MAG: hypothetical protein CM15mP46_6140 [Alphaproteobacteria bacterium]|nr:MAG: hypothetical protein CM15mP46_6140 [Alphaproteobacteria bacterium]